MRIFLIVFALFVSVTISFLAYMGLFKSMEVKSSEFGPYSFFYKPFLGPYEEVGPIFKDIREVLKKQNIKIESMAGIYYDDPKKIEAKNLRSEVGAILSKEEAQKHQSKLLGKSLKFKRLPRQNYISTEFPFRNMISVYIGIKKAYSALEEYIKKNSSSFPDKRKAGEASFALEVYMKEKILYLMKMP